MTKRREGGDSGQNRSPGLFRGLVDSRTCAIFLLPAPEYEQQLRITYQDGRDRVLAGRRSLLESATNGW